MSTPDTSDKWREQAQKLFDTHEREIRTFIINGKPAQKLTDLIAQALSDAFKQGLEQRETRYGYDGRFSVYGTTECQCCQTGRVTLFIANQKCISCDPKSYESKPEQRVSVGEQELEQLAQVNTAEADILHAEGFGKFLDMGTMGRMKTSFKAGFRKAQSLAGDAWPSDERIRQKIYYRASDWAILGCDFPSVQYDTRMEQFSKAMTEIVAWIRDWKTRGGK